MRTTSVLLSLTIQIFESQTRRHKRLIGEIYVNSTKDQKNAINERERERYI